MNRFAGQVCLVTGTTGIAAAAARALAAEGGHVFVASRNGDHVEALVRELGDAAGLAADLTHEDGVQSVVDACVARYGRLDCAYNVAGISARRFGDGPLHEMTLDGWRAAIDNNATSIFLVCRAVARQMLTQEPTVDGSRGTILNMSSAIAQHPEARHFVTHGYAASKGAIEAFSRSLAAYYAPHRIRVNVIAPGLVATPMSRRAQDDAEIMAYVARKQPLAGGALTPEDMVGTALYLLSDDARMVTGQVVAVDGGWALSDALTDSGAAG